MIGILVENRALLKGMFTACIAEKIKADIYTRNNFHIYTNKFFNLDMFRICKSYFINCATTMLW